MLSGQLTFFRLPSRWIGGRCVRCPARTPKNQRCGGDWSVEGLTTTIGQLVQVIFFCFLRPSTHFWIHECNQLLYTPLTNLCLSFKANAEYWITWQKVTPSLFVLLICRPIQRVPNHTGVTESFHAFVGHGALSSLLDLRAAGGRCGLWLSWTGWGASPRPQSQALQSEVTLGILGSVLGLFFCVPWYHLDSFGTLGSVIWKDMMQYRARIFDVSIAVLWLLRLPI